MGFAHHSNYLRYFEIARLEWLSHLGISYKKMEQNKLFLPVVSVAVKYLKPCYFDDLLRVGVNLEALPKATLAFHYSIYNQENILVCSGATRLAFLNAKTQRPTRCPSELYRCFESVLSANQR